MSRAGRLIFGLLLLILPSAASAWWDHGHRVVGEIAWRDMQPSTRARIGALLSRGALLDTPGCPVRTIEQAGVWADCIKSLGERFSPLAAWHYQSIDICRPFDPAANCDDGNCLSAQIADLRRRLADAALPERERLTALVLLIHLVADLHQPLHVSDRGDQGGFALPADYGVIETNLHFIWDGHLGDRALSGAQGSAAALTAAVSEADQAAIRGGEVTDWMAESWQIGRTSAYGSIAADPCAGEVGRPLVTEAMTRSLLPVVRRQIVRAGLRLARILDEALA